MLRKVIYVTILILLPITVVAQVNSTKHERNFIREGNKMYSERRYADAEKAYQKALQENESSLIAKFNLATTYLRQANVNDTTKNGLLDQSMNMLNEVAATADNALASKAYYDLGNIYYNQKNYAASVEFYKNALRKNPDDDKARENLRLAQKQLKDQQGGGGGNNNDDKQNEKQNQDQNKKKDDKGQDQNKQNPNDKQAKQPPQNGMTKENAEQILQTMQNEEKNTQDKVNKAKMQQMKSGRRTNKQW